MKRLGAGALLRAAVVLWSLLAAGGRLASAPPAEIVIDYPREGSIFPPDFAAPTFLWRDPAADASAWRIDVEFAGGSPGIRVESRGERPHIGEIDPRAVADTNKPPVLTGQEAAAHTWKPDDGTWEAIKKRSLGRPATIVITGLRAGGSGPAVSRGRVRIRTSADPVGAPVFYRDVPLMPSELEKGVIKPLDRAAIPLIAWRLRNVAESRSRLLMDGLHTCANCHSFSADGKTLGMDLDGPRNDKGMYAIAPVKPRMSIGNENMVSWTSFLGKPKGDLRIGFMSQVSPDGQHVVTMINGWDANGGSARDGSAAARPPRRSREPMISNFYVANFKDYGFLQVFYPTGGILAWYSREAASLQPLPGADDPRYVHTGAVWSPDGKYLVFARAEVTEAYPKDRKLAERAGDPDETPIQYDLYRIPFNGGKGGRPEPIAGASRNGMSNNFPKVSPDGRWIVFVQCRNGQLMRPDSQLYIVPAKGGPARKMQCNTPLMNSWHSFSPNGRWMVFSSKARSPYTQMYLTHLDEDGRDSPPILIENATAANRAVNIPEFVNVPPGGLLKIDVPAVEFYRLFDAAWELAEKGRHEAAVEAWREVLAFSPGDARVHMNLGVSLVRTGKSEEGITHYRRALEIDAEYAEARMNLGVALAGTGKLDQAISEYRKALEIDPEYPEAHSNYGAALAAEGRLDEAITHYRQALAASPASAEVHSNLGVALARTGRAEEALIHFRRAAELNPGSAEVHNNLALALTKAGRASEAAAHYRRVLETNPGFAEAHNGLGVSLVWQRSPVEAVAAFAKALELNPDLTEAHQNLGDTLYYLQGRTAEALAHWREVLRIRPDHLPVLNQTARVLATSTEGAVRDGAGAVALAERAARLSGGRDPAILDTLAAAYAEAGRFPEAVETARRALALAEADRQQTLAGALRGRIALYETGTPLRVAPHSSPP